MPICRWATTACIAEADLPHVFERLYVAEHSPAVQESGSGLGLAIVRDLTERMGFRDSSAIVARRGRVHGQLCAGATADAMTAPTMT